jgi:hypothetical protein
MSKKTTRRDVLRAGLGVAAGALAIGSTGPRAARAQQPTAKPAEQQSYEATVPDTLDMADRANWALRGICNTVDPDDEFQMWFEIFWNNNPPYLKHSGCDVECTPKFLDGLTQLRLASGSREYTDVEQGMEKALMSYLDPKDGMYYAVYKPRRKWHLDGYIGQGYQVKKEDYAVPGSGGIMLTAMVLRNELGLTPCEDQMRALARGLERLGVKKDDYAYYPEGGAVGHPFTCTRSGWKDTREPAGEHEGGEGSVVAYYGYPIRGLSMYAARTGDQQSLDFAGKMARFTMKPKFWGHPADPPHVIGCEQGHMDSHFHARAIALRGLLEYGLVAGDARACEFVRSSYEYMRHWGIGPIGFIPCWPHMNRDSMEGCLLGDLVAMTIKMSRAGIGDYWDDADRIIRNHLAESQYLRRDLLERVMQNSPKAQPQGHPNQVSTDKVLDRTLGTMASYLMPTSNIGRTMQCCTCNAARGIAYAWDGILDADGDRVQVNLLLNRASPWLDVNSYLPFEGKVVILNKTARRVAVRIPSWVNRRKIQASVNGSRRQAGWIGAYQVFDDLKPGDAVQIEFPVLQQTVHLTAKTGPKGPNQNTTYAITFRGNTVVDITPRDQSPAAYPMYQRDAMKADKAPMKTVQRHATTKVAKW